MDSGLLALLGCPVCRTGLVENEANLLCGACGRRYPVVDGTPHLVLPRDGQPTPRLEGRISVPDTGWVRAGKRLVRVPSPTFETLDMRKQVPRFLASFPDGALIANVGSAALRYGSRVLNVDLFPDYGVDVVGDATQLPLQDGSVDGFISRRVLEHVCKPGKAVAEMHRALKPGGRVWCEIPFLQGYHPTPTDFQRYTKAGMADLFDQFTVVELGVASGPSSTVSWVMREYLAILFSFNNPAPLQGWGAGL